MTCGPAEEEKALLDRRRSNRLGLALPMPSAPRRCGGAIASMPKQNLAKEAQPWQWLH